jgi:hypothetical protein
LQRSSSEPPTEDEKARARKGEKTGRQKYRIVRGTAYVSAMERNKKNCIAWKVSGQCLLVLLEKVSWKQGKESGNEEGSAMEVDRWQNAAEEES